MPGPAVVATDTADIGLTEVNGSVTEEVSSTIDSLPARLVLAFFVLVIGWYLSKLVVRLAGRTVARKIERPSITRSVLRGIRVLVLLGAAVVAALILEVSGVEILLSVTVISAVVAVILAPLVGSLINGVFILTDRPFEIGDMIEVTDEGHRGFVEDITIRYTKIFTLENTFIVIPNSEIHERDVINYSAEDKRTRVSIEYEITYESDLDEAITLAKRAARSVDDVITGGPDVRIGSARYTAAPTCDVTAMADSGIELTVRFWVTNPYKLLAAKSDVFQEIRTHYANATVDFAYPHRHHVFDETSGTARFVAEGPNGRSPATGQNHRSPVDGQHDDSGVIELEDESADSEPDE